MPAALDRVRHVFVIVLENEDESSSFGRGAKAPYLAHTLTAQGELLPNYYGIAHASLPNYIAMVSGQAPNEVTQSDCAAFTRFRQTGTVSPGQAVGRGCVYPSDVPTVADQLTQSGLSWAAYQEGMSENCQRPSLDSLDRWHKATRQTQYATRHNPFAYFRSLTDSGECQQRDVPLDRLPGDLGHADTTANLTFITPDLCSDGHDPICADGVRPGGMRAADQFLRAWVPRILDSPAYHQSGMLVITFDEAESGGRERSAAACCGEAPGPNVRSPGKFGPGGGKVGAVVLSPFANPGSVDPHPYNHYSLLATLEAAFGLPRLGYAATATPFGADVLPHG